MNELIVVDRASGWRRLKALVLDSVSSPITRVFRGIDCARSKTRRNFGPK